MMSDEGRNPEAESPKQAAGRSRYPVLFQLLAAPTRFSLRGSSFNIPHSSF
jgi:hypothetical protein